MNNNFLVEQVSKFSASALLIQLQSQDIPIFDKDSLPLERKKKYKDRRAGIYVDVRKVYPPFKIDKDLFFLCDYPNPENNDRPCNLFFGAEKSIYAHYSRVHNKQNNPNRIRLLEKIQHVLFNETKLIKAVKPRPVKPQIIKTYKKTPFPKKQFSILDFNKQK